MQLLQYNQYICHLPSKSHWNILHNYDIYQIFTGEVSTETEGTKVVKVLSNVRYGLHYHPEGYYNELVPENFLETLMNADDPEDILNNALKTTDYILTPEVGKSTVELDGLTPGYYLIKDITEKLPVGETKSPIILQVLENVTVASKHASIVSEKKVDDKNDSTTAENGVNWQDSADYDIGDDVPFRLSVTLPSTLNSYDTYELTFHDNHSDSFDAPQNFVVYIMDKDGATKIIVPRAEGDASGYQVLTCTNPNCEFGGCDFNVKVGDIKVLYGENEFADGDKLIVEYTAKLNNNAHIGRDSDLGYNENGMYVCHPDGHTPQDFVSVLTYKLMLNKVNGDGELLPGAGFTLYKWYATGEEAGDWVKVGDELGGEGSDMTGFEWVGVDGGKYKLVETTTPAGYNTIADMVFTIEANHKEVWSKGGNSAFMDLIAKDSNGAIAFADAKIVDGISIEDGILEGEVVNHHGAVLPETGAKGTIMLIGTSSLLVMVAAVFMITRKKMSIYED